METMFKLKDRCSFVAIPGEGLILDPEKRTYFKVNESAAIILYALNVAALAGGGMSREDLLSILKSQYLEVDDSKVMAFLDQMMKADLIELDPNKATWPANAAIYPWEVLEIKNFVPPSHEEYGKPRRIVRVGNRPELGIPVVFIPRPPKILNRF